MFDDGVDEFLFRLANVVLDGLSVEVGRSRELYHRNLPWYLVVPPFPRREQYLVLSGKDPEQITLSDEWRSGNWDVDSPLRVDRHLEVVAEVPEELRQPLACECEPRVQIS